MVSRFVPVPDCSAQQFCAFVLLATTCMGLPCPDAAAAERVEGFFDSNGVKIRYVSEGTGEPLVLIHGFAARAEMWEPLFPALTKDFRVIALDCRGHGQSDKPYDPRLHGKENVEDIVRLLDSLKIDKAHLAGYSMGAEIAGNVLVIHPERLLSVTLGGGGPAFEPTAENRARQKLAAESLEAGKGIGPVLIAATPAGATKPTPEIADAISKMIIGDQDQKALAASVRGGMTLEVTEAQLKANRVPVQFIYGSNDGTHESRQQLNRIAKLLGAQIQVIDGGDHVSTLTRPEFLGAMRSLLAKHRDTKTPQQKAFD
jgi:pimeloyl-ACP methyl ester carboxylesterase